MVAPLGQKVTFVRKGGTIADLSAPTLGAGREPAVPSLHQTGLPALM